MGNTNINRRATPIAPPRLPAAPQEYNASFIESLSNTLRLYFNQLGSLANTLVADNGGRFINTPHGSFYDTTTQSPAVANTAYLLTMNSTDTPNTSGLQLAASNTSTFTGAISGTTLTVSVIASGNYVYKGMAITGTGISAGTIITGYISAAAGLGTYTVNISQTVTATSISGTVGQRIIFQYPGVYNFQFSVQAQNSDNAQQDINLWLKQNSVDLAGSNGLISIPARKSATAGEEGHGIYGWNYYITALGDDALQMFWSSSIATVVTIKYYAAGASPTRPATSSVVATVSFVSSFIT